MSSIRRRLNIRLAHRRPTVVDDGAGGSTTTMVDLTAKRCRLSQASASERLYAAQAQAEHDQPLYFDPAEDVRKGDEFSDGAFAAGSQIWRVTDVIRPSKAKYVRADVELIQTRGDA